MENPFATENLTKSLSNYPVSKGGPGSGAQPGHPFNGNQYASANNGGSTHEDKVGYNIATMLDDATPMGSETGDHEWAHDTAEEAHRRLADAYDKEGNTRMANAHRSAAGVNMRAAENIRETGLLGRNDWADAHQASEKAENLSGRSGLPTHPALSEV